MLFDILLLSLFASAGSGSRTPERNAPALPRSPTTFDMVVRDATELELTAQSSEVFDIGFQLENEEVYAGTWEFAPPAPIPIPGSPITVEPKDTIEFTLNCNDCRTYGEIEATLDTEVDGVSVGLAFNKAGAYLDLGISASNTLTATFTLGQFLNVTNLTAGAFGGRIGLGLNLVLSLTTAIDLTGGFQLCIPDGGKLAFNIGIGVDPQTNLLTAAADLTSFPDVTFSLLPIEISSTAVNITAALVLVAEAGITTEIGPVSGTAAAGASLTIVEVNLGVGTSNQPGQCSRTLSADIESNAGAFALAGLLIDDEEVFEDAPNVNVSTVFATAGTTVCVGTKTPTIPTLAAGDKSGVVQCAGGVPATTSLTTVTRTQSLTSCLAPVVNCPASLTQLVVITKEAAITTTICPGTAAQLEPTPSLFSTIPTNFTSVPASKTIHARHYTAISITTSTTPTPAYSFSKNTTISASIMPPISLTYPSSPACPTGGIQLDKLVDFVTAPLAEIFQTIAPPENATITGSPELPSSSAVPSYENGVVIAGAGRVRMGDVGSGGGLVLGPGLVLLWGVVLV